MAIQRKSPMDHPVVVTFLILTIITAMSFAAEVLKPLALAVLLSFALAPLAAFLERRRVPRAVAVIVTVVLALGSRVRRRLRCRAAARDARLPTTELSGDESNEKSTS